MRNEGTGLGLVITRHIVEQMGGSVKFTSTVGVGSALTIHVPLEQLPPTGPHAAPLPTRSWPDAAIDATSPMPPDDPSLRRLSSATSARSLSAPLLLAILPPPLTVLVWTRAHLPLLRASVLQAAAGAVDGCASALMLSADCSVAEFEAAAAAAGAAGASAGFALTRAFAAPGQLAGHGSAALQRVVVLEALLLEGLLARGLALPHAQLGFVPIGSSKEWERLQAAHPAAFKCLQPHLVFRPAKADHVAARLRAMRAQLQCCAARPEAEPRAQAPARGVASEPLEGARRKRGLPDRLRVLIVEDIKARPNTAQHGPTRPNTACLRLRRCRLPPPPAWATAACGALKRRPRPRPRSVPRRAPLCLPYSLPPLPPRRREGRFAQTKAPSSPAFNPNVHKP